MSEQNIAAELEARLGYKKVNFYENGDEAAIKAAYDYAPGYMAYLDAAKTERVFAVFFVGFCNGALFSGKVQIHDLLIRQIRAAWSLSHIAPPFVICSRGPSFL